MSIAAIRRDVSAPEERYVVPIHKHSTPLECKHFGIGFSILTAKQWHSSGVRKHIFIESEIGVMYPVGFLQPLSRTHVRYSHEV